MRRFEFAEEQRQAIADERLRHPDPTVRRRMRILSLPAD